MMHVRAAVSDDLHAVLILQAECHAEELLESAACLASVLCHGASFVVDGGDGALVAYALAHAGREATLGALLAPPGAADLDAASVFLHDVAVARSARGAGIARRLVAAVLARAAAAGAREAHLVALPGTAELWRRMGFRAAADGEEFADAATYGAGVTHMVRMLGLLEEAE